METVEFKEVSDEGDVVVDCCGNYVVDKVVINVVLVTTLSTT